MVITTAFQAVQAWETVGYGRLPGSKTHRTIPRLTEMGESWEKMSDKVRKEAIGDLPARLRESALELHTDANLVIIGDPLPPEELRDDLVRARDDLRAAADALEWVPATERLPEEGVEVWICQYHHEYWVGCYIDGRWETTGCDANGPIENVAHWKPITAPSEAP